MHMSQNSLTFMSVSYFCLYNNHLLNTFSLFKLTLFLSSNIHECTNLSSHAHIYTNLRLLPSFVLHVITPFVKFCGIFFFWERLQLLKNLIFLSWLAYVMCQNECCVLGHFPLAQRQFWRHRFWEMAAFLLPVTPVDLHLEFCVTQM